MLSIRFDRRLVLSIMLVGLLLLAGCGRQAGEPTAPPQPQKPALTVNVIDIRQGDAILVRAPGTVTLIDTGDVATRDKLVAFIRQQGITQIDNLILTHPHADHIGGAAAVLEAFPVKQIYDSGQPTTSSLYRQYLSLVQKKKIPLTVVKVGNQLELGGGVLLRFLGPPSPAVEGAESNLNNNSLVARLSLGTFAMLLPGDAEQEEETALVKKYGGELKGQVLKSGHHGSRTSSSSGFLKAVSPETVIISVGAGNDYHHPHPSTIKRYEDNKYKIYRTDTQGTVTVTSDGKTYNISKEK